MPIKRILAEDTRISGTDKTLIDFWNWGFSDLLSNSLRGIFAEFLIGSALDCLNQSRIEWDAYDLIYRGKKIEVKSAAYVQSWHTDTFSKIGFNIGQKENIVIQLGSIVQRLKDTLIYTSFVY